MLARTGCAPASNASCDKSCVAANMIREFNDAQRAWDATHEEGYWWYFSDQDGPSLNSYVQMEAIRPRLLFWLVSCTSTAAIFPADQP